MHLSIVDKRREKAGEVAEMTVIGNVEGKKCIIVDDMVDTAGTLCKAAEVIMDAGASRCMPIFRMASYLGQLSNASRHL